MFTQSLTVDNHPLLIRYNHWP